MATTSSFGRFGKYSRIISRCHATVTSLVSPGQLYLSGKIESTRLDVAALALGPLRRTWLEGNQSELDRIESKVLNRGIQQCVGNSASVAGSEEIVK
jgi:hypothetical protein